MKRQYLEKLKLPESPGIYIFRDYRKRPLYIGRATSLKDRTKSYFSNDLIETRGPRIVDMVTKAKSLTCEVTGSVLEAIILESALIKRYQPIYNVDERDDKSDQYIVITDESWPRVFLVRARDLEKSIFDGTIEFKILKSFGPFTDSGLIKEALKILRKMFPFRDKKSHDPRHEAFYQAIGRSPERDSDGARKVYLQTIRYLVLFFEGNTKKLRRSIEKNMEIEIKELRFEEAGHSKRLLYALDHINDIALIKKRNESNSDNSLNTNGKEFRIEAYDVAHISGTNVVGAMTVSVNGQLANSEYRKFKISKEANNDNAGLAEILERRLNHSEWTYPDIIVVDGNEVQMRTAENLLKVRRINIPVIAVTKDEHHKADKLIGNQDLIDKYEKDIIALNAEAHRFAIRYHRLRRLRVIIRK
ncbi:MAG: GIY-YIG nuclease family protein [Candidatus Paceibacterota bacterium]